MVDYFLLPIVTYKFEFAKYIRNVINIEENNKFLLITIIIKLIIIIITMYFCHHSSNRSKSIDFNLTINFNTIYVNLNEKIIFPS